MAGVADAHLRRGRYNVPNALLFGFLPLLMLGTVFVQSTVPGAGLVGWIEAHDSPFEKLAAIAGRTVGVPTLVATYPSGYAVTEQTETGVVVRKQGADRGLYFEAHTDPNPPVYPDVASTSFEDDELVSHPGYSLCRSDSPITVHGMQGVQFALCYTSTRSDGSTYPSVDYYWFGTDASQGIFYEVEAWASIWNWYSFLPEARGAVYGLAWKLTLPA